MFEHNVSLTTLIVILVAFSVFNLFFVRWVIASAIVKGLRQYEREREQALYELEEEVEEESEATYHPRGNPGRIEPTFSR